MKPQLLLSLFATVIATTTLGQNTNTVGTNDPHDAKKGTWIGVTGTVESTSPGSFQLDYGDGNIKVELEPSSTKKHDFIKDEHVRVFGVVDDGFFKARTIRAHAVYVESLRSYVCTTEGAEAICSSFAPTILSGMVVHGRVTKVDKNSMTVDEGDRQITIDTDAMNTANVGTGTAQAAQVGDMVTVLGHMDEGLFSRKMKADAVEVVQE
jgi:hypothetical protein